MPLNLLLLGNSLSKGPNWNALPMRCNVGIIIAKMLLMPAFAIGLMLLVDATLGDEGVRLLPLNDPYDQVLFLAGAAVAATPTANNMLVMVEVAGGDKTAMATAIFSQVGAAASDELIFLGPSHCSLAVTSDCGRRWTPLAAASGCNP